MSDKVNDCNVWQPRPGVGSVKLVRAPHITVMSGILSTSFFTRH